MENGPWTLMNKMTLLYSPFPLQLFQDTTSVCATQGHKKKTLRSQCSFFFSCSYDKHPWKGRTACPRSVHQVSSKQTWQQVRQFRIYSTPCQLPIFLPSKNMGKKYIN